MDKMNKLSFDIEMKSVAFTHTFTHTHISTHTYKTNIKNFKNSEEHKFISEINNDIVTLPDLL